MEIVTLYLDPISITIILSEIMLFIASIILLSYFASRPKLSSEGDEMYIGGESEEILRLTTPSTLAFYWGVVKRVLSSAFNTLRDTVHSGKLSDWLGYMSIWFGFLLLVMLVLVVLGTTLLG